MPPILEHLFGVIGKGVVVLDVILFMAMLTYALGIAGNLLGAVLDKAEDRREAQLLRPRVEEKAFEHYGRTGTDPATLEADLAALEEVVAKALEPEPVLEPKPALQFTPRNIAWVKQYSRERIRKELQRLDAVTERFSEDEEGWRRALVEEHERLTELVRKPVEVWRLATDNDWRIKRLNVTADEYRDLERALGGDPSEMLGCRVEVRMLPSSVDVANAAFYDSIKAVACSPRTTGLRYAGPTDAYGPNLDKRRY